MRQGTPPVRNRSHLGDTMSAVARRTTSRARSYLVVAAGGWIVAACGEPPQQTSVATETGSSDGDGAGSAVDGESAGPTTDDSVPTAGSTSGDPSDDSGDTGTPATTGAPPPGEFEPFACDATSPDVTIDRLCDETADPEGAPDKVFITCRLEGSCVGPAAPDPKTELLVMAYNVERGIHVDEHIAAMLSDDVLPSPDVLLLSEVDRGCARTGERNVAWDYAEGLGMNHVYGVEFVELPRPGESITAPCEHGNAVLSRYPIGNVELVRHATNKSWYDVPDEPRLGGRMAIVADILVGDRLLQVHSLHFESGLLDGRIRAAQAAELADLALTRGVPAVIGGDANSGAYILDLVTGTHNEGTTEAFFDRGFLDTHVELPPTERATHDPGLVLDLIFTSELFASNPGICPVADCGALSDHLPVWATIAVPES